MFDRLVKRSNCVWIYQTGRFAEERRIFLAEMNARGYGLRALRILNPILLAVAERMNIRREGVFTEKQILRAAEDWVQKRSLPVATAETRNAATKRFIYVAKNWFRFLGKWQDPVRNPQFKPAAGYFSQGAAG